MKTNQEPDRPATVAGQPLADLPTYVQQCKEMDGETVGEYVENNWNHVASNALGMACLIKEMRRKFRLLNRNKQADGTVKKIRGFTSWETWVVHCTGKSVRMAYYLLETLEEKNERNAKRRAKAQERKPAAVGTPAGVRKDRDYFCRIGRALNGVFKGQLKERLDELSHLEQEQVTTVAEEGLNEIIVILKEVSETAGSYATALETTLQSTKAKAA